MYGQNAGSLCYGSGGILKYYASISKATRGICKHQLGNYVNKFVNDGKRDINSNVYINRCSRLPYFKI